MGKEFSAFSPTRVDLAGGTLDLWPLFNFLEEAPVTINLGIDIFSRAKIISRQDSKIVLSSKDMGFEKTYSSLKELKEDKDKNISLLKEMLLHFSPKEGFELYTESESPVGAGLGGSSSLCISMIKAFKAYLNISMDTDKMVQLAHNIESRVLRTPTGTQDYFPPILGGLMGLKYGASKIEVEALKIPEEIFAEKFLLVYTGKPHHSGMNNWQVMKEIIDGNSEMLMHLQSLSNISKAMLQEIKNSAWDNLNELFLKEFYHRTQISPVFAGKQILDLQEFVMSKGASSVKICGAGGGGCVIVWCEDGNKKEIAKALEATEFQVLNAKAFVYGD